MALQEMKDFSFVRMRQISVFKGEEIAAAQTSLQNSKIQLRFVTACNRFGLIFCITPNSRSLVGFPASELHKLVAKKDNADIPVKLDEIQGVKVARVPGTELLSSVSCSCDGLTIAITTSKAQTPFVLFYDVRSFSEQFTSEISPIAEARISTGGGSTVTDFRWNPTQPNEFCASASDGTLLIGQVNEAGAFSISSSKILPSGVYPTSLCWSPKGKQIVVAKSDGSLEQFTPALVTARNIPTPTSAAQISTDPKMTGPFMCVTVQWLSTLQFATVYAPIASPQSLTMTLLTLTKDKTGQPTWKPFDDVCFAQGNFFMGNYFFHHVSSWNLIICASSNAQEAAVVGASANGPQAADSATWNCWDLDESARAEIPTPLAPSGSSIEPHCIGTGIDFTSKLKIRISETVVYEASPILLMYSTDGFLVPYHIVNRIPSYSEVSAQITKAPEKLSIEGIRKGLPILAPEPTPLPTAQTKINANPAHNLVANPAPSQTQPMLQKPVSNQGSIPPAKTPQAPSASIKQPVIQSAQPQAPKESGELAELRKYVGNERQQFEIKLSKLKSIIQQMKTSTKPVGTKEEIIKIPKDTHALSEMEKELSESMQGISQDKNEIVQWALTGLMAGEETNALFEHRRGPEFKYLMRHKPLDLVQQKRIEDFKSRVATVEDLSTHHQARLQSANSIRGVKQKKSLATVNAVMTINRTIDNMQDAIADITQRLHLLNDQAERNGSDETPHGKQMRDDLLGNVANLSKGLEKTKIMAQTMHRSPRRNVFESPSGSSPLDSSRSFILSPKFAAKVSRSQQALIEKEKSNQLSEKDLARIEVLLRDQQTTPQKTMVPELKPPKFKWQTQAPMLEKKEPSHKVVPEKSVNVEAKSSGIKTSVVKPPQIVSQTNTAGAFPSKQVHPSKLVRSGSKETTASSGAFSFQSKTNLGASNVPFSSAAAITPTSKPASSIFGAAPKFPASNDAKLLISTANQPAKPFSFGAMTGAQALSSSKKQTVQFKLGSPNSSDNSDTKAETTKEHPVSNPPLGTPVTPPEASKQISPPIPKATSTPAGTSLAGLAALSRIQKEPTVSEKAASPILPVPKTPEVSAAFSFPVQPQETTASAITKTTLTPKSTISAAVGESKTVLQRSSPALTPPPPLPAQPDPPASTPEPKPENTPAEAKEKVSISIPKETISVVPTVSEAKPSEPPVAAVAKPEEVKKSDPPVITSVPKLPDPTEGDTMEMVDDEIPTAPSTQSASVSNPTGGFSFAQPAASNAPSGAFGTSSPFGSGGFFSGLGSKPSEAAAKGNVFGGSESGLGAAAPATPPQTGLFGSKSAFGASSPLSSGFGAKPQGSPSSFGGAFSSGGGAVASQGFGAFGGAGSTSSPGAGFGQKPAFGGSPSGANTSFGAMPAFGGGFGSFGSSSPASASSFGGGASFGGAAAAPSTGGFAALAQASGPTFGSLAAGGTPSTFGGFGSAAPPANPAAGSIFGGTGASGTSSFGASTQGSFAQWR